MGAAFTVRVDDEILATLDELAAKMDRPRSWLVHHALQEYVSAQAWQIAKIEAGIAAADRGEFATEEELDDIEAEIAAKIRE